MRGGSSRMQSLVPADMMAANPYVKQYLVQPVYDRENLNAASGALPATRVFFTNPIGTSVNLLRGATRASVAKTKRDTNLTQNGQLSNIDFAIHGIALALFHDDPDNAAVANDRHFILSAGRLEIVIDGSKILFECPLAEVPVMNDIIALATTATTTTMNAYRSVPSRMFSFPLPHTIDANRSFNVNLHFDDTTTTYTVATDAQVFLIGGVRKDS